ncbi:MAG: hypothetical protein RMK01_10640, partial [Thermomicrobium sp.]|nr:hypothetical protein [Thermomicrobium sp.]
MMRRRTHERTRHGWIAWIGTLLSLGLLVASLATVVQPIGATSVGNQTMRTIQIEKKWDTDSGDGIGMPNVSSVKLQVTTTSGTTTVTCSGSGTTWTCTPTLQAPEGSTVTIQELSPPTGWKPDQSDLSFKVPSKGSGTVTHTVTNMPVTRKLDFVKQWLGGGTLPNQNLQLQVTVDDPGTGGPKTYNESCSKSSSTTWSCSYISKVQVGSTVTIVEQNLPSDWEPVAGTLSFTMPDGSGTYTHTIQNQAKQTGGGGGPGGGGGGGGGGGQAGTTLSAEFRNVQGGYVVDYDWSIEKSADVSSLEISKGESREVTFTITVTRSEGQASARVTGQLCVENGGAQGTQGLQIVFYVDNPPNTAWLANETLTPSQQIPAGRTECYPFDLTFTPVSEDTSYRVGAKVTITNHSGHLGEHFGPNPKESFELSGSSETDASATVSDTLHCPDGFTCDPSSVGPWTVSGTDLQNDSWTTQFTVKVTNESVCASQTTLTNTATVTESGSGARDSDDATVAITVPDCPTEPQTVSVAFQKVWDGGTPPEQNVTLEVTWDGGNETLTCSPSGWSPWSCGDLELPVGAEVTIAEPSLLVGWEFAGPSAVTIGPNPQTVTVTNQLRTYTLQFEKAWTGGETPDSGSVALAVSVNGASPITVTCAPDNGEWTCAGSVDVHLGDQVTVTESMSEDLQGSWEPAQSPIIWTADASTLEGCTDGTCTLTVTNRYNPPPQTRYVVRFEKEWQGGSPPSADEAAGFTITASSDEGTVTCTWDGSALACDPGTLELSRGDTYSVSEENVPDGWATTSGVGEGLSPIALENCEQSGPDEDNVTTITCTHRVVNTLGTQPGGEPTRELRLEKRWVGGPRPNAAVRLQVTSSLGTIPVTCGPESDATWSCSPVVEIPDDSNARVTIVELDVPSGWITTGDGTFTVSALCGQDTTCTHTVTNTRQTGGGQQPGGGQ